MSKPVSTTDEMLSGDVVVIESPAEAVKLFEEAERARRRLEIELIDLMSAVESSNVYYEHRHSSAKVMAAHVCQLSGAEAAARDKVRRMLGGCQMIDRSARELDLGVDQMRLMGRVFANARVRDAMVAKQGWFIVKAKRLSYKKFAQRVQDWLTIHDQDGPEPDDKAFERRDAKMIQDYFSQAWQTTATSSSLRGAIEREIFDAYIQAEFFKDWEAAKAEFGADVSMDKLARTGAHRRADAMHQIFLDAAANPNTSTGAKIVHTIVWDQKTFFEMFNRLLGADPNPLDVDDFICNTIDGHRIDPAEAIVSAINDQIRRAVIDAKGVTIDLGTARLFTGISRLAARLMRDECVWPGCHVSASGCETDHRLSHDRGGLTNQDNADPMCRRHNRQKEGGFTVHRKPDGDIHITTPNGDTIIERYK